MDLKARSANIKPQDIYLTDTTAVSIMLSTPDYTLHLQSPADEAAILALHERTFGPGRFARTAFRIRETAGTAGELCFIARSTASGKMVGSVILSHITIGGTPSLLLGPLTVTPEYKSRGAGKLLMRQSVDSARAGEYQSIILVGDEPYYGPFGFRVIPHGQVKLPGPVDPARLLACVLTDDAALTAAGDVKGAHPG
tara:strand:- start:1183 stop:1773 length:591 start_codon:yes stop_codon:yes gene_type:complete